MNGQGTMQCGWIAQAGDYRAFPALRGEQTADWLILGGGFTGLSAARELAGKRPDERIVLIEAKRLAQGATARNSGFNVGYDLPEGDPSPAGMASFLAQTEIDRAGAEENARLIGTLGIDCDYRADGFSYAVHDTRLLDHAETYADVLARAGASARILDADDCRRSFGTGFYTKALWIGGGGNGFLQPAEFSKGLVDTMPTFVELYENTPAIALYPRSGGGAEVEVAGGRIRASRVILALNGLLPRFGYKKLRMMPLTLTASLTRPLTPEEDAQIGHPPPWAILCPIKGGTTARLTVDRRVLIRNTLEYRPEGLAAAEVQARRATHLIALQRRFPFLGAADIEYSWSGTMAGSRGYRFLLEEVHPGVMLAGCCNGNGVSRLSMLGRLAARWAMGEEDRLLAVARSLEKPGLLPPDPILRIGVGWRFARDRAKASAEL
jgi:glycine/D-amino acid oxidase-like deaminating enzyme